MADAFQFGSQAVRQIKETVRLTLGEYRGEQTSQRQRSQFPQILRGYMDAELSASSGTGATATTATMSVWADHKIDGWSDLGIDVTVTNRDDNLTVSSGALCYVIWIGGEWVPIWASCT